ncbi:cytochrome C [candidate division GN15 bacterium]|uniref:Cytochrome C n=1 Tax=candidate division GN15 bacterium TaxID=2072418 RepID=A0A855XCJ1_9BACT|nr:MAG: cytochrome C [candidate division GN15 bacterium]
MDTQPTLPRRSLFRHPLAAFGGALFVAGAFVFAILFLIDMTSGSDNPYSALVTFVIAPAVITIGAILFLFAVYFQVRAARKRGEHVRFSLRIDPSDPTYMRNLWLFLGFSAVLILVVSYSGYRAYEATDSVAFCGKTCHTVMEPQYVTYLNSPHARVPCVECHIGPGASFFVRSKIDGTRQLFATAFNTYSRPIQTPVHNLRPAQETCERCHWPKQFWGDKYTTHTYYRTDEANSPYTISMLVKVGGGNPRTGKLEGIHWHMIASSKVEYIATDPKRQIIPWVRTISPGGDTTVYKDPNAKYPDPNDPKTEIRRFDCMDCHNRPSHKFLAPATALNLALSSGTISTKLPYIRQVGLDVLNAPYLKTDQAVAAISEKLTAYYQEKYPDVAKDRGAEIAQAIATIQTIYKENFFPEMKTDYRARENNLSHFVNDGCFRCHDQVKVNDKGEKIRSDCFTCHLIVAQGPSEDLTKLTSNIAGLEFQHPEDIGDAWKESKCTECHTPESGY